MIPVKDDKKSYRQLDQAAFAEEVKLAVRHMDTAGELEDQSADVDFPQGLLTTAPGNDEGGTPGDASGESGDPGSIPGR